MKRNLRSLFFVLATAPLPGLLTLQASGAGPLNAPQLSLQYTRFTFNADKSVDVTLVVRNVSVSPSPVVKGIVLQDLYGGALTSTTNIGDLSAGASSAEMKFHYAYGSYFNPNNSVGRLYQVFGFTDPLTDNQSV